MCPTLRWNKTYHAKPWIKNDDKVWPVEPKDTQYQWIEKLLQLLPCSDTLFFLSTISSLIKDSIKGGYPY